MSLLSHRFKVKLGADAIQLHVATVPISVSLPLVRTEGQCNIQVTPSLPSLDFLRYSFINQFKRGDRQMDKLHADCPGRDSTWTIGFSVRHENLCTTDEYM